MNWLMISSRDPWYFSITLSRCLLRVARCWSRSRLALSLFSLLRKSQLVKIVPALFNFALYLTALELELVRKGISLSFKSLKVFPDRRNPCSDVSGQSGCLLANVLLSSESNRLLDLFVDHARRNQSA